jgi:hypothetical protein
MTAMGRQQVLAPSRASQERKRGVEDERPHEQHAGRRGHLLSVHEADLLLRPGRGDLDGDGHLAAAAVQDHARLARAGGNGELEDEHERREGAAEEGRRTHGRGIADPVRAASRRVVAVSERPPCGQRRP